MSAELRAAIFVDKDGTLIENRPYNVNPRRVVFPRGTFGALQRLAALGYLIVVVSNQPGIELHYFDRAALDALSHWLKERLADAGIALAGFYACPHAPADGKPGCTCRKPSPGLLLRAARELDIALDHSWMIGDILDDVEAGERAGCNTVLVDRGGETRWRAGRMRTPRAIVYDFADAVTFILDGHIQRPRRLRLVAAQAGVAE